MREHKPMFYDFGIRADWHDRRSCRMPGRLLTGTACNTLSVPTGTLISVPDRIIKRYSTSALARRPTGQVFSIALVPAHKCTVL